MEVCSKCHPFFTGKQKLVDTGGRVAKFNKQLRSGQVKTLFTGPAAFWLRVLYFCRRVYYIIR